MTLLSIVAALALSAAVPAGSAPASARLAGTATLKAPATKAGCRFLPWEAGGTKKLYANCSKAGPFAGTPAAAASYAWEWDLVVGASGRKSGSERGTLTLAFGRRGVVELATLGTRTPAGQTMKTTGTWTLERGTRSFAGERGRGTYTFTGARLTLEGTLG